MSRGEGRSSLGSYWLILAAALLGAACKSSSTQASVAEGLRGEPGVAQLLGAGAVGASTGGAPAFPAVAAGTAPQSSAASVAGAGGAAAKGGAELDVATRWLEALRSRDMRSLVEHSVFPLEFRDTGEEGHCEGRRTAIDAASLGRAIECLTQDELVMGIMHAGLGAPPVDTQSEGYIKPWAKQWRSEAPSGAHALLSYYDLTDEWLSLILWVDAQGVRAVWKTGMDLRAEVSVAEKWRVALRNRDVAALTGLASYPFEVRDEGLNAHCRKGNVAKGPEQMPAALRCLLSDKTLNRALHDSPDSTLDPQRDASGSAAFPEWYRKKDHAGLWPIFTLAGTEAGYEFDLSWLMAKDGVRAFWKRGSFVEP